MAERDNTKNEGKDAANAEGEPAPELFKQQDKPQSQTEKATQTEKESGDNKRERFRKWLHHWNVVFQLIVPSLFSLGVIIIIAIQAGIYSRQLTQMKKATKAATQAAKASKESSDTAKRSIDQIERNAHLDQRAWVAGEVSGQPEIGHTFFITITIINTGKTFAKNVELTPLVEVMPKNDIPNFPLEVEHAARQNATIQGSKILIPPNGRSSVSLTPSIAGASITDDGIKLLKSGNLRIFVFGRITYDDIFRCDHWTIFCATLEYNPSNLSYDASSRIEGRSWAYIGYKTFNDADDKRCQ